MLDQCHLPALQHFECYLTLTNSLVLFLNRHPEITYLQIAPNEALGPVSLAPAAKPQVFLPNLQHFVGNSECISALTDDVSLRAAFIFWDAVDATPQDAITSLERSSSNSINLLSCRRRGWNLDLLGLISIWLPNIYVLSITNLLVVDSHPTEVRIEVMYLPGVCVPNFVWPLDIPGFNHYSSYEIHCPSPPPPPLCRYLQDGKCRVQNG